MPASELTGSCVTQNFFLDIQKTLLHPWCVQPKDTKETTQKIEAKTYADYLLEPSAKLDMLVNILSHHLVRDGAPGMSTMGQMEEKDEMSKPSQHESQPQPQPPLQQLQQGPPLPPDKIIVYSDFPSSFWLIRLVSD